jgi:hypothetical protein
MAATAADWTWAAISNLPAGVRIVAVLVARAPGRAREAKLAHECHELNAINRRQRAVSSRRCPRVHIDGLRAVFTA